MKLAVDILGNELFAGDIVYVDTHGLNRIKKKSPSGNIVFEGGGFINSSQSFRFVKIDKNQLPNYFNQLKALGKDDYITDRIHSWIRDRK